MKNDKTMNDQEPSHTSPITILIVDDELIGRKVLESACRAIQGSEAFNIMIVDNIPDAFKVIHRQRIHVVLLDKNVGPIGSDDPDHNGIEAIPLMLKIQPPMQILMVTASDSSQDIVQAIKFGAFGYLIKGKRDTMDLMGCQIEKAISIAEITFAKFCADHLQKHNFEKDLGGQSMLIRQVYSQARAFADSERPMLLLGPTGIGKTTLAKMAHEHRKKKPKNKDGQFVAINIGAMQSTLVEGELFGHEKGSFTDAKERKIGLIEMAHKGTLFLDEIGDASHEVQVKLLKVLDEKVFRRVGGRQELACDFKLICATHRDLKQLVAEGKFREDLYFRISTFEVKVPPLSERPEDIPDIIKALLPRCCADNHVYIKYEDLPRDFIDYLVNTPAQGNIRGIERPISRLLASADQDKHGNPNLKPWRRILGVGKSHNARAEKGEKKSITLQDLMNLPFDVVGEDFPGVSLVLDTVKDKIYRDALRKYKRTNAVAKVLKISSGHASMNLAKLRIGEESIHLVVATAPPYASA